ncbi:hypothetical protein M422DRAFT_37630 [Sphaerobolus stellatus SS14]|uniref:Uncharacterized protein n=1 Tax=Sphaerobolus stellatus (strain SS14) TaxID=990650 RepID=A0A0C9UQW3_SPHS4|nr:hypothetical protein M422DRAFT_37630 [Sphaerobolus stellatus SS14]
MICGLPMVVSIWDSKASHLRSIENAEEYEDLRDWEREQELHMENTKWMSKAETMGVQFTEEFISSIEVLSKGSWL